MKRYWQKTWVKVVVVVLAALTGTWAMGAAKDRYEVAKMTEKMKTVCVGRMLIDLPEEAQVDLYRAWIDGFDIDAYPESHEAFRKRLAAREDEIRAQPDRLDGNRNLESAREVKTDSGLAGKIFVHGRNVTEGQSSDGFTYDHYRYEGVALEAHVHGDGISIDVSAKDYDPDLIDNLPKLVSQLAANPHNSVPIDPGFCLDHAYVRDPLTADQGERIMLAARLPSRQDILIRFDTMAGIKPDSRGLLERAAASYARAPAIVNLRLTKLRAAARTIAGLAGEELVERVLEENFSIVYGFEWDVNGTEDNVFLPELALQMKTGSGKDGPVPSSLSQPAALALWDAISSSIRIRPAQAPTASADPPWTPLGAFASAGDACPADGWWQCSAGGGGVRVHGGQRQYIRQGERMPQALLLPQQTLWEKVRGLQPSYEDSARTAWKLADRRSRRRLAPDVPLAQAATAPTTTCIGGAIERTSVGTYAITGNTCPASGWWQCQESDALDGTRWFAQGSLLPAATFALPARTFGKSSDTTNVTHCRATWQLVRLAPAPDVAA